VVKEKASALMLFLAVFVAFVTFVTFVVQI
jgi:hypothetical protein